MPPLSLFPLSDSGLPPKLRTVSLDLFALQNMTLLTPAGMNVLDHIAHGSFRLLAESFPEDEYPRSPFQLLTHVANLLTKE